MNTFDLHRFSRELQILVTHFMHSRGPEFSTGFFVIIFAVLFIVVGFARIVEFDHKGFGLAKRRSLVALHIVGIIAAFIAMVLFGLDTSSTQKSVIGAYGLVAFAVLVPLHIYLNLVRRFRLRG